MKKLDALIQEEDKLRRMKAEKTARTELPRTTEPTQPNQTWFNTNRVYLKVINIRAQTKKFYSCAIVSLLLSNSFFSSLNFSSIWRFTFSE